MDERLKEAARQTLLTWVIGPEATKPEDLTTRRALNEKYLEPCVFTLSQYKARLARKARGAPVSSMKGIPILLLTNELRDEEDSAFVHWVHQVRRLSSMWALRASASVADV